MNLSDVNRGIHGNRKRKRIGRGKGSGDGKTAGRGHKGAGSRNGTSTRVTFTGGNMSLIQRIPKRGFNNRWALTVAVVNLGQIDQAFAAGEEVTQALAEKNLARGRFDLLKVLGDGELTKKLKISAHRFSASAAEKIKAAGGEMVLLPGRKAVEDKKRAQRAEAKKAASPQA
ncbi:MAG TPA: 50S ribosomal protein L15 [Lacipirellulaceae bacterium]|nr:50S ribosomal protein L15 [Lacipirellulaceae bacterium]